jgi:hypothetical protein
LFHDLNDEIEIALTATEADCVLNALTLELLGLLLDETVPNPADYDLGVVREALLKAAIAVIRHGLPGVGTLSDHLSDVLGPPAFQRVLADTRSGKLTSASL